MAKHRIRDTIHDIIEFAPDGAVEEALWKAIQTPAFQRLRRIKQLGFSNLVYPGATHSRFSHSIGSFHIARSIVNDFKKRETPIPIREEFVLVGALLHDIGHGPFSHAFERVYDELEIPLNHETITSYIVESEEMRNALKALGDDRVIDELAKFFRGEHEGASLGDQLIASQFDVDRLDYIQRDQVMTGTKVGTIDYRWLIDSFHQLHGDDGERVLALSSKAIPAAELYIINLFLLYSTVYLHKTTRGAEVLLRQIIAEVFNVLQNKGSVGETGIYNDHPLIEFGREVVKMCGKESPNRRFLPMFLKLDDETVVGAVRLIAHRKQTKCRLRKLANCLLERDLPKSIDVRDIAEEQLRTHCPGLFTVPHDRADSINTGALTYEDMLRARVNKEVTSACVQVEESVRHCDDLMYDHVSRAAYDKKKKEILVGDTIGVLKDLRDVSHVVRALGEYSVHRVYFMVEREGGDYNERRQEIELCARRRIQDLIVDANKEEWVRLNELISSKSDNWLKAADEVAEIRGD